MRRLSQEEVYNIYKKEGYILNSVYKGMAHKDKLTCPDGHNIEMTLDNFKRNKRCAKCAGNQKLSHDFVSNYYKDNGYTMTSIYTNARTADELICPVGHKIKMSFNNFKDKENRCLVCSGHEKLSHEFVFNYYKSEGYTLKSIYNGCSNKDDLICPDGHNIKMTLDNFKYGNKRCRVCAYNNLSGEGHYRYNSDRTIESRSRYLSFNIKKYKILKDDPNYTDYLTYKSLPDKNVYEIDHIFPRIAFIDNNLDNIYGQTFVQKICNLRENLRIIPKKENGSKAGKYNQEEFMTWFNEKLTVYHTI